MCLKSDAQQGLWKNRFVEKLRTAEDKWPKENFSSQPQFLTGPQAVAPKRTETNLDTPGSCIVTPYSTGAMLIVFLLCVMSTNCVCTLISFTSSVKRPTLASSRGASTSSRMQNGLGAYWNIPTSSASAVSAFSPPDSSSTFCRRLPGGDATTSIPL